MGVLHFTHHTFMFLYSKSLPSAYHVLITGFAVEIQFRRMARLLSWIPQHSIQINSNCKNSYHVLRLTIMLYFISSHPGWRSYSYRLHCRGDYPHCHVKKYGKQERVGHQADKVGRALLRLCHYWLLRICRSFPGKGGMSVNSDIASLRTLLVT